MDLSYRFDRDVASPIEVPMAALLAAAAARQSASVTAQLQILSDRGASARGLLAPSHGAFNLTAEQALNATTAQVNAALTVTFSRSEISSAYNAMDTQLGTPRPDRGKE